MKKNIDEILLGFDIRFWPECYVKSLWDQEMRKCHLLKPEIDWPLTVDQMMWPSIFDECGDYDIVNKLKTIYVDDDENPQYDYKLHLWLDKEAMKTHYFKNKPESFKGNILIAVVAIREDEYIRSWDAKCKKLQITSEPWCNNRYYSALPKNVDFKDWIFLGYDVTDSMYSGLVNCGYTENEKPMLQKTWVPRLNEYGLLPTFEDAVEFKEMTNKRVPEHAPFFVYKLFRDPNF